MSRRPRTLQVKCAARPAPALAAHTPERRLPVSRAGRRLPSSFCPQRCANAAVSVARQRDGDDLGSVRPCAWFGGQAGIGAKCRRGGEHGGGQTSASECACGLHGVGAAVLLSSQLFFFPVLAALLAKMHLACTSRAHSSCPSPPCAHDPASLLLQVRHLQRQSPWLYCTRLSGPLRVAGATRLSCLASCGVDGASALLGAWQLKQQQHEQQPTATTGRPLAG